MLRCSTVLCASSPLLLRGYQLFHTGGPLHLPRVTAHSVGRLGRGCTLTRSCKRIHLTPQQVRASRWPRHASGSRLALWNHSLHPRPLDSKISAGSISLGLPYTADTIDLWPHCICMRRGLGEVQRNQRDRTTVPGLHPLCITESQVSRRRTGR